uniref:Uncharacterized protein n=1 Tax=Arundo donax TaxID=35708 RepID=A0A0A9HT87_ARUDO
MHSNFLGPLYNFYEFSEDVLGQHLIVEIQFFKRCLDVNGVMVCFHVAISLVLQYTPILLC